MATDTCGSGSPSGVGGRRWLREAEQQPAAGGGSTRQGRPTGAGRKKRIRRKEKMGRKENREKG